MTLNLTIKPPADAWQWWPVVVAPLLVALCAFLARRVWSVAVAGTRRIRSFLNQVIVECPIKLDRLEAAIAVGPAKEILEKARLYCLLVRSGTDAYLASTNSAQERYEGRLINRFIEIDRGGRNVIAALPVHWRLGLQCKFCFVVPEGREAGELWQGLRKAQAELALSQAHAEHDIILDERKPVGRECWFRLAACGAQETVDGFRNSYLSAAEIHGFGRRNRWWWIGRGRSK